MATGVSDFPGLRARASQEETSPFLLEFMVASPLGRQQAPRRGAASQDETSPFLLEFQVVARGERSRMQRSDAGVGQAGETARLPKTFLAVPCDGEAALKHAASVHRSGAEALPRLTWRGIDASAELREYAARIASGEELPPYRGPILASGEFPDFAAESSRFAGVESSRSAGVESSRSAGAESTRSAYAVVPPARGNEAAGFIKLALALIVLAAALVGSAVLGDDAALRAAGESIGSWLGGGSGSLETFPVNEPGQRSTNAPCEAAAPAPTR